MCTLAGMSAQTTSHVDRLIFLSVVAVFATLTMAAATGCRAIATIDYDAGPTAEPGVDPIEFAARDSGILVGPLAAAGALEADVFWPVNDRADRFMVTNAKRAEPVAVTRRVRVQEEGRVEIVRTPASEASVPDFGARTVLERDADGNVVVRSNVASEIESRFDPASLFLPARLGAGERAERPFSVDATGPRIGSGEGEGTVVVEGLGLQPVRTPAGDFEAFVFRSSGSFSIGPATITRTRRAWVSTDATAPGLGIVAEESGQSVKVFGIAFSNKSWVSVLVEISVGDP